MNAAGRLLISGIVAGVAAACTAEEAGAPDPSIGRAGGSGRGGRAGAAGQSGGRAGASGLAGSGGASGAATIGGSSGAGPIGGSSGKGGTSGAGGGSGAGAAGSGAGAAGSGAGGVGGAGSAGSAGAPPLPETKGAASFANEVQPLIATQCKSCHLGRRFGFASLARAGQTFTADETASNYQTYLSMISLDAPAQSRLLQKALGEPTGLLHAGGAVVQKDDASYQAFAKWIETERQERCVDCGLAAKSAYVGYVEQPEIFWALAWDPYRGDHGLRDRAKIMLQKVEPATSKLVGAPIDFLGDAFCGQDGRCDFGRLAVSHAGDRLAFECRLSLEGADWVNEVRWNLCIAEIDASGHAQNPRFLLPKERRHHGSTVARSDPFGLPDGAGGALKGPYDLHFQTRRAYDSHPVFSPDDTRVYFASQGADPRTGAHATQTYHGTENLNHIVAAKIDGTDLRTIYLNDGGVADAPFFLKNGNVAFHTWNLERMDRHLYTQSTADGMNELPVLLGRLQGPNMWGDAVQLANGGIVGITGRRRSSVALYVPFFGDHTLGIFGDHTGPAPLEPSLVSMKLLDPKVFGEVKDFPEGYCTAPPDGPSCATSGFYADIAYAPDGRALVSHNPEKTYVLSGEDMFLAYAKGGDQAAQVESMRAFVPKKMGIARLDHRGQIERLIEPPAGKALRHPVWIGKTDRPLAQPWITDEAKKTSELHIANVPLWLSFARIDDSTSRVALLETLARVKTLRVLTKELDGNFCLNDGRPYRFAVNAGSHDHPTHLGINNATGYVRLAVPASAGGDAFGDVPLSADGSVKLTLPAGQLLLFQGIDADGHVVAQRNRLLAMAPGHRVDTSVPANQYEAQCLSCHGTVTKGQAFKGLGATADIPFVPLDFTTQASAKPAVDVATASKHPATFLHALRPIVDAKCVSCHGGETPAGELSLAATYSAQGNYPAGKWAKQPGLADGAYLSFVPPDKRVPSYAYSVSYAWGFKEDETPYKQSASYAPLLASHAPLAGLSPWDPAYQNLFANDGQRWVYLGGYFTPNFGRSDRLGGVSQDAWLIEVLTGRDLDKSRGAPSFDHTKLLTDAEVRSFLAVIDVGFPYMARCDDRTVPSGPNAGKPWGDATP